MRFFLKLFLSFWLVVSLLGGGFFWSGHQVRDLIEPLMEAHLDEVLKKRLEVVALLENQGKAATRNFLENHTGFDEILVYEQPDRDILDRPLPDYMTRPGPPHPPDHPNRQPPPPGFRGGPAMPGPFGAYAPHPPHDAPPPHGAPPPPEGSAFPGGGMRVRPPHVPIEVKDQDGNTYRVAITRMISPGLLAWQKYPFFPFVVLLISGAVVFPLARHFTRPLRRLQGATLRLAEGELTTRAPVPRRILSDELDDLARDFNFMAERLEALFHGQKRLLRDVSHELRSPLARMRVALGLAEQENSGVRGEYWQRVNLELDRIDTLIGQIIRVSRPEAPDQVPKDVLVDLAALVETVIADARFESSDRAISLLIGRLDPVMLWADGGALHSAVENVVRNALRHAPKGSEVQIQLVRHEDQARILVQDQGPGVPAADLPRITEPFFRGNDAGERTNGSGGHGLGLAIAACALRDHGGTFLARNRPAGGLEVEMTLPVPAMPHWEEENHEPG
ncbi:MAG: HAMP domain-containing protein [Magnetococcales bacterium]|nr:HAMP domain-containing protein [Magnetococcales bacterium]